MNKVRVVGTFFGHLLRPERCLLLDLRDLRSGFLLYLLASPHLLHLADRLPMSDSTQSLHLQSLALHVEQPVETNEK